MSGPHKHAAIHIVVPILIRDDAVAPPTCELVYKRSCLVQVVIDDVQFTMLSVKYMYFETHLNKL